MIRATAPLPAEFDPQALADQVGALCVNVIEPDLLAAYWDDDNPAALDDAGWAAVVAGYTPEAVAPTTALEVLAAAGPEVGEALLALVAE